MDNTLKIESTQSYESNSNLKEMDKSREELVAICKQLNIKVNSNKNVNENNKDVNENNNNNKGVGGFIKVIKL